MYSCMATRIFMPQITKIYLKTKILGFHFTCTGIPTRGDLEVNFSK